MTKSSRPRHAWEITQPRQSLLLFWRSRMRKVALIALFTTATALGSYAVAQTPPGPALPAPSTSGDVQPLPEAARPRGPFQQITRADMDALTDARVAAIQAGLKLNAEQQKL